MVNGKVYLRDIVISEGQFSNESAVKVTDYQKEEYSGFFNNKFINDGGLEVNILGKKGDLVLVRLPGKLENFGATNYLTVRNEQLDFEN